MVCNSILFFFIITTLFYAREKNFNFTNNYFIYLFNFTFLFCICSHLSLLCCIIFRFSYLYYFLLVAERTLESIECNKNHALVLLRIVNTETLDISFRINAAIEFNNYIRQNWTNVSVANIDLHFSFNIIKFITFYYYYFDNIFYGNFYFVIVLVVVVIF